MHKFPVYISDENVAELSAVRDDRTLTAVINSALKEYFERHKDEQPEEPVSVTYQEKSHA